MSENLYRSLWRDERRRLHRVNSDGVYWALCGRKSVGRSAVQGFRPKVVAPGWNAELNYRKHDSKIYEFHASMKYGTWKHPLDEIERFMYSYEILDSDSEYGAYKSIYNSKEQLPDHQIFGSSTKALPDGMKVMLGESSRSSSRYFTLIFQCHFTGAFFKKRSNKGCYRIIRMNWFYRTKSGEIVCWSRKVGFSYRKIENSQPDGDKLSEPFFVLSKPSANAKMIVSKKVIKSHFIPQVLDIYDEEFDDERQNKEYEGFSDDEDVEDNELFDVSEEEEEDEGEFDFIESASGEGFFDEDVEVETPKKKSRKKKKKSESKKKKKSPSKKKGKKKKPRKKKKSPPKKQVTYEFEEDDMDEEIIDYSSPGMKRRRSKRLRKEKIICTPENEPEEFFYQRVTRSGRNFDIEQQEQQEQQQIFVNQPPPQKPIEIDYGTPINCANQRGTYEDILGNQMFRDEAKQVRDHPVALPSLIFYEVPGFEEIVYGDIVGKKRLRQENISQELRFRKRLKGPQNCWCNAM